MRCFLRTARRRRGRSGRGVSKPAPRRTAAGPRLSLRPIGATVAADSSPEGYAFDRVSVTRDGYLSTVHPQARSDEASVAASEDSVQQAVKAAVQEAFAARASSSSSLRVEESGARTGARARTNRLRGAPNNDGGGQ